MLTVARFLNDLDRVIQQWSLEKSVQLGKGQIKNMEEYNRKVGQIEGANQAVAIGRDMLRKIELDDDAGAGLPEMDNDQQQPLRRHKGKG